MKIGIIGAGNIGGNLTRLLTAAGHDVRVANSRGPQTLTDLAAETGATAVPVGEAANGAEVVIVTIPEKSVLGLSADVLDGAVVGAVIIDTNNYYPQRDGRIDAIESGTTESRWVAQQLGRPVVKAFNGIQAQHLLDRGVAKGTPGRIALPIAGDDAGAKAIVMTLIEQIGFDPVDAGSLDDSWRQQPGTPVYGADLDIAGTISALAKASPDRPVEFRAPVA